MNLITGIKNLTRQPSDPVFTPPPSIAPPPSAANPLEGHDVAIYIDGKRRTHTKLDVEIDHNVLVVYMETTLEAALNDDVDASTSLAWNGFKPEDVVNIREPGRPICGTFQILRLIMPDDAGPDVRFEGTALTNIYDMESGTLILAAGDTGVIAAALCERMVR